MASGKLPWLPDAIYFDANTLIGVNHTLKDATLETIISFAKKYRIELIIPQVVWIEWLWNMYQDCRKRLQRLQGEAKRVGSLLGRPELQVEQIDQDKLFEDLSKAHGSRVKKAGFKIIGTPDLKVEQLLMEAVVKEGPFEAGGKGFRDAVILETAARHAAKTFENPHILVVSNDAAVQASGDRLERHNVTAAICSAADAGDVLNASLSETVKEIRRQDSEAAMTFLEANREAVFEFVRAAEVSLNRLQQVVTEAHKFDDPSIQRIEAVNPVRIASARPGFPLVGEDPPDDQYPFPFSVEVEFQLVVRKRDWTQALVGPMVPLARPTNIDELPDRFAGLFAQSDPERMTTTAQMRVDATVSSEGAEKRQFKDLQMLFAWL